MYLQTYGFFFILLIINNYLLYSFSHFSFLFYFFSFNDYWSFILQNQYTTKLTISQFVCWLMVSFFVMLFRSVTLCVILLHNMATGRLCSPNPPVHLRYSFMPFPSLHYDFCKPPVQPHSRPLQLPYHWSKQFPMTQDLLPLHLRLHRSLQTSSQSVSYTHLTLPTT